MGQSVRDIPAVLVPQRSGDPRNAYRVQVAALIHAFADASSWKGVVERLQKEGHTVGAPANPLRGLANDTAYIVRTMGQRAGANVVEIQGSHLIMVSQPEGVTDLILEAARAGATQ